METLQAPPDDPLRALFSGKREHERIRYDRPVNVLGHDRKYVGLLVDLSEGGALLSIVDPAFYAEHEDNPDGLTLVQRAFPDGLSVDFGIESLSEQAQVVRITAEEDGSLSLGCKFEEPLSPAKAVVLGVRAARVGGDDEAARLDRFAGPGLRVHTFLYEEDGAIAGPRSVVRTLAVGPQSLLGHQAAPNGSLLEAARPLAGVTLKAVVKRGTSPLWESLVELVACERWERPEPGYAYHLLARDAVGRGLRKLFVGRGL
jgi:hypothetical protein